MGDPPAKDDPVAAELPPAGPAPSPGGAPTERRLPLLLVRLAAQDWLVLAYLTVLFLQVLTGHGPRRATAIQLVAVDLAVWMGVLALTRTRILDSQPLVRAALYRLGIGFPILGSFLQLQWILPTAGHAPLDATLYGLDLKVFGFEPAEVWDRYVTIGTTEWFAFFYYGYFFLIAVHTLPMLAAVKSSPFLARYSFGFVWLYCVGHALYTFVPAYGPYSFLASSFQHPLEGTFWWPLVKRAVDSVDGGARTDVFPSLHTALPTYLSLFSFTQRKRVPFKYTWLPLSLFTTQIIGATMFLRWHYLIDICAGLTLATSGIFVSRLVMGWDARRERQGGGPVYPLRVPPANAAKDASASGDATASSARAGSIDG